MALLTNSTNFAPKRPAQRHDASRPVHPICRGARRSLRMISCITLCVLWMSAPGWAQLPSESVLKAAFLYHFAKFVEWPEEALSRESDPFTICLIGEQHMTEATNQFVKNKQVHGRTVVARAATSATDVEGCHLLFVDASARHAEELMKTGNSSLPILTVGESDQFLSRGGMIKLFIEDGKMRFAISPQAAERAQLKISSKLLALGKIADRP